MNWDAVGAIASMIGAFAVVASLLYLATQIRQNTISVRAATFQNIIGAATAFNESISRDPELARIFVTGLKDLKSLSDLERARFHFQILALVRRAENFHYQSRIGLLDDDAWEGLRASLLQLIGSTGAREWWGHNTNLFNKDFRIYIEQHLAKTDSRRGLFSDDRPAPTAVTPDERDPALASTVALPTSRKPTAEFRSRPSD